MLKVRTTCKDNVTSFICPFCKVSDVVYMDMPYYCWNCGNDYKFDILCLINNKENRYSYYRYEKT